ncbi:MAG: FIST C-terminal domain-containing protein [Candidatus Omnitrophota bacterium]
METEAFAIAFSERLQAEAIKEVSLKIKLIFPKKIDYLIILSTPDYHPANILKTVNLTLKPRRILGIQSPFLIFEDKLITKGIVVCCINKEGVEFTEAFSKATGAQEIESFLISSFKKLRRQDYAFFSFISSQIDPTAYLRGVRLALGRFFELLGCGFTKKYSYHNSQIINNAPNEGLMNIAIKGLRVRSLRLGGYVPLGKPFTITKTTPNRDVIIEINHQPAINIYQHYLEEKFDLFIKNHLFAFYPLGISTGGSLRLINILDRLEDGSLICRGEAREGGIGYVMFLDAAVPLERLKDKLAPLRNNRQGLTFVINSLTRKKTLGESAKQEIVSIKKTLGDNSKVIGLYTDYSFVSDKETGNIDIETGNLLITTWE